MTESLDKIERTLLLKQPILKVWQAITEPDQIRLWFGSDCQFELEIGALGFFEWEEECEGKFAMQIVSVRPPEYFAWRWMLKENVPFAHNNSTLVEWYLKSTEQGTRLTLTESGFANAKHVEMNNQGWDQELDDLQQFLK